MAAKAKVPATSPENRKYEFVAGDTVQSWDGRTLTRIRALVAIGMLVAAGDLGGYIEAEGSLRVYGDARVFGDARVYGNAGLFWASKVGSESGTFTAYRREDGTLLISRGCFLGTDAEFLAAVAKRHGADSKIGKEYALLVEVARSRVEAQP
jgi:hypothetical protein